MTISNESLGKEVQPCYNADKSLYNFIRHKDDDRITIIKTPCFTKHTRVLGNIKSII